MDRTDKMFLHILPIILWSALSGAYESYENETVTITFDPYELKLEVGYVKNFYIKSSNSSDQIFLSLEEDNKDILIIPQKNVTVSGSIEITVKAVHAGKVTVYGVTNDSLYNFNVDTTNAFISVDVCQSLSLDIVSAVIGWIYFAVWTLSFYPQCWENYRRKSVIGLNFDFVVLNLLGHTCYNAFNVGLFWIPFIQKQYFDEHPHSHVNPVQINDVAFSMHAMAASFVIFLHTFIYEKGDQKISRTCYGLLGMFFVFILISLILSIVKVIIWLEFFYYVSYVKLAITLLKYFPQAYYNFRRKSTVGWSIGNVLMDFTGGLFSIIQMFIIAYNYSDWGSIFGDLTKFGLGMFSVLFDILFIIQHYILYRKSDETANLISVESDTTSYSSSNESLPTSNRI